MNKQDWVWMPHAGHFMCGHECRFHLATYVGGVIVSTVGELVYPTEPKKYQSIYSNYTYQSVVVPAVPGDPKYTCCPYTIICSADNAETVGYNDANAATAGHMALCEKWANIHNAEQED
jgi:hypothetical protein